MRRAGPGKDGHARRESLVRGRTNQQKGVWARESTGLRSDLVRTRRRGHARDVGGGHVVAMIAAEAQKLEPVAEAFCTSSRPEPVASTVAPFDCSRGGETR